MKKRGTLFVIELSHGELEPYANKGADAFGSHLHALGHHIALVVVPTTKHKVNLLPTIKLIANAKAKTWVAIGSQQFANVLEPIVTTSA